MTYMCDCSIRILFALRWLEYFVPATKVEGVSVADSEGEIEILEIL